jgi:flagellar capping protein FliD
VAQLFAGDNGLVAKLDKTLDGYLSSTGTIKSRETSLNNGIKKVGRALFCNPHHYSIGIYTSF